MPVPQTSRQYLPDLEARWKLSRRKILELARDGKLPLWIHLINVKFFRVADEAKKLEWTPHAVVQFSGNSLYQLCESAGKAPGFFSCLYMEGGEKCNFMNGVLRDGSTVIVTKRPEEGNPRGAIFVEYRKVFAFVDDVERLDKEFSHDGEQLKRPPYLDPGHKYYSGELALAVEVWMKLLNEDGKFTEHKAAKEQIKEQIEDLLKEKREELSKSAIDRITTMINPKKSGGAPPTDEGM